jgi:hypothetical protein
MACTFRATASAALSDAGVPTLADLVSLVLVVLMMRIRRCGSAR